MHVTIEQPIVRATIAGDVIAVRIQPTRTRIAITSNVAYLNNDTVNVVAAQTISALRVVRYNNSNEAVYATPDSIANVSGIIGVAITSALIGETIAVRASGYILDALWTWGRGSIWLGASGTLTQAPPTIGSVHVEIARAISETEIIVNVQHIINRG